jgi:uncharacterized membrane protein
VDFTEIHPLVIHFPIALFSVGFLCDILSCFFKKKGLELAGRWNLVFGFISSVVSLITGVVSDLHQTERVLYPFPLHENHAYLQIFVVCVFLSLMVWRTKSRLVLSLDSRPALIYLGVLGIAVGFLFYGSHLGAVLSGRI